MSGREDAHSLPPGQQARTDFPRFGTHLHLRPPEVPATPTLEIAGAVRAPFRVRVDEIGDLERCERVADLHCVSAWSATGLRWEGIPFAAFYAHVVAPAVIDGPAVTHLVMEGHDGYRVVVCLEDALGDDVLLAERLDGKPLADDHGAPIRFVSPSQYGYVSAKHLARIEVWTSAPDENFSAVHPLGRFFLRGPLFQRHPRGRVWHEERHRYLPARVLRPVYAPLRAPIRWLSARGGGGRP